MIEATLAVLAGGEGKRMGRPKAELTLVGQPILAYLPRPVSWPGPTLLVTSPGRDHPPGADRFDAEAVDPVAGEGPLRGLLTALENTATSIVVMTTIDMPGVSAKQFHWLIDQLCTRPDTLGVMCSRSPSVTAATSRSQIEPFPCVLRDGAIDAVRQHLRQRQRSVHALLQEMNVVSLHAPGEWGDDVVGEPQFARRP